MNIQAYMQILRRRGWLIVLAVLITAVGAFGFSKLQTPVYRSSVQIGIQGRTDWGAAQTVKILMDSYVSFIYRRPVAEQVIEKLGLMRTPEDLKSDVTLASDTQNLTIQIDVDDYDGEQANRIAKAWAEQLVQWRDSENQLQLKPDRVFATILEEPRYHQLRPKTLINTVAGAIFGLLIGALLVIGMEWLDAGLIRSARDIEQQANLTVVGIIPPPSA
ncbi:MAG: Wzz/FepE/Etk N-terminal domain-containing protein [Chloroflexota bacterium]|nr:Wzz/FepE/Etk N-terminal domain-containing protein [Chloroflexota bacterium]